MDTNTVQAGGVISPSWRWSINRDCPRDVELWLISGERVLLSKHQGSSSGAGVGERHATIHIQIPEHTQPGEIVIRSKAEFYCNPLRAWRSVYDMVATVTR